MRDTLTPTQVARRDEIRARRRRVNAAARTKVKMNVPTQLMHFGIIEPDPDGQPIHPLWCRKTECRNEISVYAPSAEGAEMIFAQLFAHNYAFSKN